MTAPRWHYALLSVAHLIAACGLLMLLLSGCSTRQRLHIATAADLATTHYAIENYDARELNPVLDGLSIAQMAVSMALVNEAVLLWEEKACPTKTLQCAIAQGLRLGMTGGHAFGASWNLYQIQTARKDY